MVDDPQSSQARDGTELGRQHDQSALQMVGDPQINQQTQWMADGITTWSTVIHYADVIYTYTHMKIMNSFYPMFVLIHCKQVVGTIHSPAFMDMNGLLFCWTAILTYFATAIPLLEVIDYEVQKHKNNNNTGTIVIKSPVVCSLQFYLQFHCI